MIKVSPFVMVIFGATGDLTSRKLMPALFHLTQQGYLPDRFFIVGFARRNFTKEQFRQMMKEAVEKVLRLKIKDSSQDLKIWKQIENNLYYQQGYFEEKSPYDNLIPLLSSFDKETGSCITRFFYLATPPSNYSIILKNLEETELAEGCGSPFASTSAKDSAGEKASEDKQGFTRKWTRVLIEKPFGKDLNEAKNLEEQLAKTFEERQIYRIDHYLAKETVRNILAFRFANTVEAIWNRDFIDHVQITLSESSGIGNRGKFYEGMGALKDVVQNHLMAMLAYTAMEEPLSMTAQHTRDKRVEVLDKIRCMTEEDVLSNAVRGQYGAGIINGKSIDGYRQEKNVSPDSLNETFVALKLYIDNSRWQDVPFYLRTGKRLNQDFTKIDIFFKNRDSRLFKQFQIGNQAANIISIRIQPKEGITFRFFAKSPGFTYDLSTVNMDFSYSTAFKKEIIDSYEKILIDSMMADQTLFATAKGFSATWEFITSVISGWEKQTLPVFPNYKAGSTGPVEADAMIERDGRKWMF